MYCHHVLLASILSSYVIPPPYRVGLCRLVIFGYSLLIVGLSHFIVHGCKSKFSVLPFGKGPLVPQSNAKGETCSKAECRWQPARPGVLRTLSPPAATLAMSPASGETGLGRMAAAGVEPTPLRTGAWNQHLRPLGQTVSERSLRQALLQTSKAGTGSNAGLGGRSGQFGRVV